MRTTISLRKTWWGFFALVALAAALAVGLPAMLAQGADHLDAPLVQNDGRLDINDVYAFQSPTNPDNTVLIMTVNPLAGVLSPTTFHLDALYELKIDNTGDAVEDITYRLQFSQPSSKSAAPSQSVTLWKDEGTGFAVIAEGKVSAPAKSYKAKLHIIPVDGGGSLFAGLRDDPFFFDFVAFLDQVKGAGGSRAFCDGDEVDFFAGLNVSAIVLEVPSSDLTDATSVIRVWGTVEVGGAQVERMGIPVIATVLIPDSSEDAYNATVPADDVAIWLPDVKASLLALSGLDGIGYNAGEAATIAGLLLPDVLTLDTMSSAGFVPGLNGRQLDEDVIDFELFVVTGGLFDRGAVLDSDCVDANDVPFLGTFPYLAPPQ